MKAANDFNNIIGIIKSDNGDIFLRTFIPYKTDENEIIFSSPYFIYLIKDIYKKSHNRKGKNIARAYSLLINSEAGQLEIHKNTLNPPIYNAIASVITLEMEKQRHNRNDNVTISIREIMQNNLIFQQYIKQYENKKQAHHLYEKLRELFEETIKIFN